MANVLAVTFRQLCILPSAVALAFLHAEADSASRKHNISIGMKFVNEAVKTSPATTFRCVGGPGNRSCLFHNLYFSNGRFTMHFAGTEGPNEEDVSVYRADKYEYPWHADIQTFANDKAIADHLASKDIIDERGLSVQFNPLFHHNIGHALFDGLYPAFLATLRLGVQDRPWRPVVAVDPGCFDGAAADGPLKVGEMVEAYVPHPKYRRTLRPLRAKLASAPTAQLVEDQCDWKIGLDHNGLDLGATGVGSRAACVKECSQTFSCEAAVLYGGTCYLKGGRGSELPSLGRELCILPRSSKPKPNLAVMPEPGQGVTVKEVNISQDWVLGRVRRRCMSEGVFETFGGMGEIRRLFELERDSRTRPNLVIRFEEIVIGVGGAGNLVADKSGAIGGSIAPNHAMSHFRNRMLRSYGLDVQRPSPVDRVLNVLVVENKRFRAEDRSALTDVIQRLNKEGDVHAEFVDWGRVGDADNKFKEHLRRTQEADVYISSIGTALQYVPFLGDGRVYIALGSIWMRSGRYFPTFMEQQLAGGGTPYLRTLYADPGAALRQEKLRVPLSEDGYFVDVNGSLVWDLMQKAEKLARQGFHIPVPTEDNLSTEAKVLVELCRRDPFACSEMNDYRNGREYECACLLWNEAVVYEVGPWQDGAKCGNSHRGLLRQLRKEYGLPGYGAPGI